MSNEGHPRFSDAEVARRFDAARALMDDKGLDALVIFGHSGNRRHYQADVHYFSNVALFHESYVVIPRNGEPVLYSTHNNHHQNARELSVIPDIRKVTRAKGVPEVLGGDLDRMGLGKARLGMAGPFFYQDMDGLRRRLPEARMTDVSMALRRIRSRKSAEELDWQRKAAVGCDRVMEALRREIRPGIEEREILIIAENAAWDAGCAPTFLYLNSTPMAASETCVPNQLWSRRKIRRGDVINTELTVNYGMYCSQILRPFFLGEPTPQYQAINDLMMRAYRELCGAIKAGTTAGELYDISLMIREAGYSTVDGIAHGFGVDIQPPSGVPNGFNPPPFPDDVLEEGMTYVVQPNPVTPDEKAGMQLGDMGVVTATGFEVVHRYPAEVTVL